MTDDTEKHASISPGQPPRRPWTTPRIFVGECGDSEGGVGSLFNSDMDTTSGAVYTGGS